MKEKISITINRNLLKNIDSLIDNLYIRNRSQAIEFIIKKVVSTDKTAVILAGGDEKKLMVSNKEYRLTAKIGNDTVMGLALKTLRKNNFRNIFLIARHNILTRAFSFFGDGSSHSVKINYVEEKKSAGSFDSLKLLKGKINTNFLVVYDDIIFNKINLQEIWDSYIASHCVTTMMLTTSAKPSEKGNAVVEGSKVIDFIQKPKKSENYIVFSPIFVSRPELFDNHGNSLEFDVFPELAKRGLLGGYLSSVKETHVHKI